MERSWLLESCDYQIFGAISKKSVAIEESPEFIVFDADWILGKVHLEGALYHAKRAYARQTHRVKNFENCILLYIGLSDQINEAKQRAGAKPETRRYCFIASPETEKEKLLARFCLQESDEVIEFTPAKARKIFTQEELESTPENNWQYLVLEKMALLDLL